MRAQVLTRFGDPSGFELRALPIPEARPGCALVRIAATSVNPVDYKIRQHGSEVAPELPAVLGADFSGRVAAVATDVRNVQVGDAVYGLGAGIRGAFGGALAEYVLVDARLLAHKPKTLDFRAAAALPLVSITAWEGLERAHAGHGHNVLVLGGTGGVGHLVVQLARAWGARVTAVVSGPDRIPVAKDLGADVVTHAREHELIKVAQEVTAGRGYDVVYDATGKGDIGQLAALTRLNGDIVTIMGRGQRELQPLFLRGQTLHFVFVLIPMLHGVGQAKHAEILEAVAALVDRGTVRPLIDPRRFDLSGAGEAHRYAETGRPLGKVVVEVADV